jgi:hypothetical protein
MRTLRGGLQPYRAVVGSGPSPARRQQIHALSPVRYAFLGRTRAEDLAKPDARDRIQVVITACEADLLSASR